MVNQQLLNYLKTEEAQGYTPEQLRDTCIEKGWKETDVDEALKDLNPETATAPPKEISAQKSDHTQAAPADSSGGITKRNPILMALISLITGGLFALYWIIVTTIEMRKSDPEAPNPKMLWLLLVPVVNIVVDIMYMWKYCKSINKLTGYSNIVLFVLLIVFFPVAIYLAQVQLNTKAA